MAEYIERETFLKDIEERYCLPCKEAGRDHNGCRCRACWVDDMCGDVIDAPAADVEKCQTDTTLSLTCMNKGSFCLPLLQKIIRMRGKASGMRTAAFLSAGDGSSWVLTPTKDVTHTTMS